MWVGQQAAKFLTSPLICGCQNVLYQSLPLLRGVGTTTIIGVDSRTTSLWGKMAEVPEQKCTRMN